GGGRFQERGEPRSMYTDGGRLLTGPSAYGLSFVDVDRDGLTDLLLTSRHAVFVMANRGDRFVQAAAPPLRVPGVDLSNPVVADVTGSGNLQLAYPVLAAPHVAELNAADTGLLIEADDGRGNRLAF